MQPGQRVLDLGCGLGSELAFLAARGLFAVGIDLSLVALARARAAHGAVHFVQVDALRLPFTDAAFDALLDRGCLHYIPREQRPRYAAEARRVLRVGGRFLLRACTTVQSIRNDVDEAGVRALFADWKIDALTPMASPSQTRTMPALVLRLAST